MSLTFTSKKTLAAALLGILGLSLSGCVATGNDAPTRLIKQVTDGAEADSGSVAIRGVLLVAQPDGSATLVATVVNNGDSADQIVKVSAAGIPATISTPNLALNSGKPVIFAGQSATASATFPGLNKLPSQRVPVTFTFASAAEVTLDTLVVENSGIYADISAPSPTPSSTASN